MDYKYIRSVSQDELKKARGGFKTLDERMDNSDAGQGNLASQVASVTSQGNAKPIVPILKAIYDASPQTYDAQDVIWAIHENSIV